MSSAFKIAAEIREIIDSCGDGELTIAETTALDELTLSLDAKAEAYKFVLAEKDSHIAARKAMIDQLRAANEATENDIARLMKNLLDAMKTAGVPKIKTPLVSVWTQTTSRVDVTCDPKELPPLLQRVKTIIEADKELIKAYREAGKPLPDGVQIVETTGLRIR